MKTRGFVSAMAIVASLGIGASFAHAADTYKIDPVHSSVVFKTKHLNVSSFYGAFKDISGKITLDAQDPAKSAVEVEIKTDSVDTRNGKRDEHLKGPDFFNAKQFPKITFKSKQVKKSGDNAYEVTGDLTLHGVTKPLTLKLEQTGTGPGMQGGQIAGWETQFTVKRSEFGMNFMLDKLGDEVQLFVAVETAKQ